MLLAQYSLVAFETGSTPSQSPDAVFHFRVECLSTAALAWKGAVDLLLQVSTAPASAHSPR